MNPYDFQRDPETGNYHILDTRTGAQVATAYSQYDAEEAVNARWIAELMARAERAEAERDDLRGLARRLAGFLNVASPGYMYGYFPGGDPRDFRPDEECCTPEELAAWQADCAAWNAGNGQPAPPSGFWSDDGSMHILAPRYGIGSYVMHDPEITALLDETVRLAGGIDEPASELPEEPRDA